MRVTKSRVCDAYESVISASTALSLICFLAPEDIKHDGMNASTAILLHSPEPEASPPVHYYPTARPVT